MVSIEEYASTVKTHISQCADDFSITRTVSSYPNQKRWLNRDLHFLLKVQDCVFRSVDASALRAARRNLMQGLNKNQLCSKITELPEIMNKLCY